MNNDDGGKDSDGTRSAVEVQRSSDIKALQRRLLSPEGRKIIEEAFEDHAKLRKGLSEIGVVGYLIGDKDHAPTGLAFFVVVFAFLLIFTTFVVPSAETHTIDVTAFSLISVVVGYAFGRRSGD